MNYISARLKEIRENLGMKKVELARNANISHSYLSEIENGVKTPPFKTLQKICSALGISLSDFFNEESSTMPPEIAQLILEAKDLSPEQVKQLTEFIKTMKK
jgi:transcriptional regulator with XRE-family HTH domain